MPNLKVLTLCALSVVAAHAQGHLRTPLQDLDLGKVEASKGEVPLRWTIQNAGKGELRLMRVDPNCPKTLAEPAKGILLPGETTEIAGTFDPRNFGGATRGELNVVGEDGSSLTLSFHGEVIPDIQTTPSPSALVAGIHPGQEAAAQSPIVFTTKSGAALDPQEVEISGPRFLGATLETDGNRLLVVPYVTEPDLPLKLKGEADLRVHFRGCMGSIDYLIPTKWERADPLIIKEVGPKTYEVSYEDARAFALRKLVLPDGLNYTARPIRGGRALLLTPGAPRRAASKGPIKPKVAPAAPPQATPKPAVRHAVKKRALPHPAPKSMSLPEIFIQMETSHPYRSDVTIDRRAKKETTK